MPISCGYFLPAPYPTHSKKGEHRDVTGFYQRKGGGKKKGK